MEHSSFGRLWFEMYHHPERLGKKVLQGLIAVAIAFVGLKACSVVNDGACEEAVASSAYFQSPEELCR